MSTQAGPATARGATQGKASVAVAARSAFHEGLVGEALAGLDVDLVSLPADLEKARAILATSRAVVLQQRWRGGEGHELLRAIKRDPHTRMVQIVGLAA